MVQTRDRILRGDSTLKEKELWQLFVASKNQQELSHTVEAMKNILRLFSAQERVRVMFQSLSVLVYQASRILGLPTSPLLILLDEDFGLDPNTPFHQDSDGSSSTLLHFLAESLDPTLPITWKNQVILGRQLLTRGANVEGRGDCDRITALHVACSSGSLTNLDFIELLMEHGADPNALSSLGRTPLMRTVPFAPGAAKFLLTHYSDRVDSNMRAMNDGKTFLTMVRECITDHEESLAEEADHESSHAVEFNLEQLREVENLLVARNAIE
jgi:ankyrin repeat protein